MSSWDDRKDVSIKEVEATNIDELADFVRNHVPDQVHLKLTINQLRLLAIQILDKNGNLDRNDSSLVRIPYFGQIYALEGANTFQVMEHIGLNFIPGVGYFSVLFH